MMAFTLTLNDRQEKILEYLTDKYQAPPEELIADAINYCYEDDLADMLREEFEKIPGSWYVKTAKTCNWPKYLKDACDGCITNAWCKAHRQLTLDLGEIQEEW